MAIPTIPYALAVDDEPIILMNIADILEEGGFRTHEASDGDAAVQMLAEHARNIILLFSDVDLPGDTDGFALAPCRRGVSLDRDRHRQLPDHPEPGRHAGEGTFISKPFTAQMVHAHLRDTLPNGKKPEPLKTAVSTGM